MVYDHPEPTSVPLSVRADWVRGLYPEARVVEARDGPNEVGDTPGIRKRHEDYVLNRLKLDRISHFYSGEFYGEHMSRALGAVNRIVDPGRETFPVSGTKV